VNDQQTSVEEEDIHAYVDGTLSDHRRLHVEQALERNPVLVARVSDYFSLNSMVHERYDHVLNEPVQTRQQPRTLRRWREATNRPHFAGLAAALAIGVGIGVGANMGKNAIAQLLSGTVNTRSVSYETPDAFAREAAIAHVVYMPSGYRPADMDADQEQEFVQLLANRLGTTADPHEKRLRADEGVHLAGRRPPGRGVHVSRVEGRARHAVHLAPQRQHEHDGV
jgi:anti-sigma factor RsiW